MLRVGCDVGGTNTDAVLVRGRGRRLEVVAAIKVPTTANVDSGVQQAISWLLEARGCSSPGAASRIVGSVMVGTTHFINALVQRKGLARVALLRLCGPATTELPPFCDMPKDLRAAVEGLGFMLPGGHDYDGREACELDEGQVSSSGAPVSSFATSGQQGEECGGG